MSMKHCSMHMDAIIKALKKRNLWSMVPLNHEETLRTGVLWLLGKCKDKKDVNPLVIVVYEIYQRAASTLPAYVQDPSKEHCPLCACGQEKGWHRPQQWIDNYSDECKKLLVEAQLVKA